MTEICVDSDRNGDSLLQSSNLQSSSSIQMLGFAADGAPQPTKASGSASLNHNHLIHKERKERANSKTSVHTSARSEPDLDTIMPLPGSGFYRGNQAAYQRLPLEDGSDSGTESDSGSKEGEGPCSPQIASFTTVEVGYHPFPPDPFPLHSHTEGKGLA